MSLLWSLKARTPNIGGRAYWKTMNASIYINNIYEQSESFGEFLFNLVFVMFHEYLHLFFKFELGKYQNSCKTIINPISEILVTEISNDPDFVRRIVDDFMTLAEFGNKFDERRY